MTLYSKLRFLLEDEAKESLKEVSKEESELCSRKFSSVHLYVSSPCSIDLSHAFENLMSALRLFKCQKWKYM